MSTQRSPAQIPARSGLLITGLSGTATTAWLYTRSNILAGLASYGRNYTFDGTVITAKTMVDVAEICYAIWDISRLEVDALLGENGDGYDLGYRSLLQEMGDEIHFKLPGGQTVLIWRQVRSLTDQSTLPIGNQGKTPVGTVGFIPVFVAQGIANTFSEIDPVRVTRLG